MSGTLFEQIKLRVIHVVSIVVLAIGGLMVTLSILALPLHVLLDLFFEFKLLSHNGWLTMFCGGFGLIVIGAILRREFLGFPDPPRR